MNSLFDHADDGQADPIREEVNHPKIVIALLIGFRWSSARYRFGPDFQSTATPMCSMSRPGCNTRLRRSPPFRCLSPIFDHFARVTFGHFCGFYLFTLIAGYLWLNAFSKFGMTIWSQPFPPSCPARPFFFRPCSSRPDRPARRLSTRLRAPAFPDRAAVARNIRKSRRWISPGRHQRDLQISRRIAASPPFSTTRSRQPSACCCRLRSRPTHCAA